MEITIIVPTYNEAKNIQILIPKLQKLKNINILVVDDNSPDKTADVVEKLQKKYRNLYLISGRKQGLGNAYLRGFKYAFEHLNPDLVIMMDADLSHDTEDIPRLIKEIDKGYDYVIGSRYIKGGMIKNWNLKRKIISKVGNMYARIITGIKVKDITSGFKAIKTSLWKEIIKEKLHPSGYAFQMSMLHYGIKNNAKIKEIPITFIDRKYGVTKLRRKDVREFIKECIKIKK